MVVVAGRNLIAFDPYGGFCPCERYKIVRAGTNKCEPCHAVEAYKMGRYIMNLKGLGPGAAVVLQNGREALIKRNYKRDPNSMVTMFLVKVGFTEEVIDLADIKSIIHL